MAYKGIETYRITEEEKKQAMELGLIPKKAKSAVEQTIEIARILKANGVDLSKIKITKQQKGRTMPILLKEIEQEGIDIGKIIEENGLDGGYPYGQRVNNLRTAYNGKGNCRIIEEEKKQAKELGLIPKETKSKSVVRQTLEIARILKANGVDLSKIQLKKTVNKSSSIILLKEIEQEGIDIGKIIEENGLDGEYPYGQRVFGLKMAYNGTGTYRITEEEKKQAKELGLILEKTESMVAQTLEVARILKANGVDLSRIKLTKQQDGRAVKILLKEIRQEGIDIGKIIEENGLDGEYLYGQRVGSLRDGYNGTTRCKITEQEREEAEELGLVRKKSKVKLHGQDIGKASFDSSVEQCDKAQGVLERMMQQEKEGGIEQSE